MSPKQESEELMAEMMPLAQRMLREYAEFFPYGGYMKPSGEIVHVGAEHPNTDRPKSKALIEILQNSFREMARRQQCKAVAIVYDVIVTLPKSEEKSDAIQVCLDHINDYSAVVFLPYKIADGELVMDTTFAQEGQHDIFGKKD